MKRLVFLAMCLVFMMSMIGGCAGLSGYKVLSFFFDGVPNPEAKNAVGGVKKAGEKSAGDTAKNSVSSTHGPYAARMCNGCHERSSNKLLAPVQELCYQCHLFKMDKKYIHGPLASGGCIVCHDPHSSANRFLLVSESETICLHCHDKKAIEKNEAHKGTDMTCTSCHNAHMSDERYLLK